MRGAATVIVLSRRVQFADDGEEDHYGNLFLGSYSCRGSTNETGPSLFHVGDHVSVDMQCTAMSRFFIAAPSSIWDNLRNDRSPPNEA